jgi:hypothetical protein
MATPAEEREELGKPIWLEIRERVPRVQSDGSLKMKDGDAAVNLGAFHRAFPHLPFVQPAAAATRSLALFDEPPQGKSRSDLQLMACHFFEAEAAGIEILLCMPELWAQQDLMQEERYRCKTAGGETGCKTPCPSCGTNEFVLVMALNVDDAAGVRFAWGIGKVPTLACASDGGHHCSRGSALICSNVDYPSCALPLAQAVMPVATMFKCHNPNCFEVVKEWPHHIEEIKQLVADSRPNITKLKKLGGYRFNGHDQEVIDRLPLRVCPPAASAY